MPTAPDARFDLSQFESPASPSRRSSSRDQSSSGSEPESQSGSGQTPPIDEVQGRGQPQDGNDSRVGHNQIPEGEKGNGKKVLAPLSSAELEAYKKKESKKGIIYISHVPHGMTVAKVRHLMEQFGPTERIYLHDPRADHQPPHASRKRHKGTAHFEEGWVEFSSKKVAKSVAALLNAQPLGAAALTKSSMKSRKNGPKGLKLSRRFTDEVWTLKYLPGFKWHMLTEQLSSERASRAARLRAELSQSQFEQTDYLRKVERARVAAEKKARRTKKLPATDPDSVSAASSVEPGKGSAAAAGSTGEEEADPSQSKKSRVFHQREAILHDVRDQRASRNAGKAASSQPTADGGRPSETGKKRKRSKADQERGQALSTVLDSIF